MVVFYNLVTFAMQENIEQWCAIKLCLKLNKSTTQTFGSLTKFVEMPLYRGLWFLSGTKLSKKAKKMLKTTLVLEDQSRQQTVKTMMIVFFDSRGIVHKEFVPPGQTVNQAFYKDVLERSVFLTQYCAGG
jgi:hypothetical protein